MRSTFISGSIAPLAVLLAALPIASTFVIPDHCCPTASAGFGGSGPIPIGAGVGATSGDFPPPPPKEPLNTGETPNPCEEGDSMMAPVYLSRYKPSDFPFVTIIPDDGLDVGGG